MPEKIFDTNLILCERAHCRKSLISIFKVSILICKYENNIKELMKQIIKEKTKNKDHQQSLPLKVKYR